MQRFEYSVMQLRDGMIGGKMSRDKLQKVLNEHAGKGRGVRLRV